MLPTVELGSVQVSTHDFFTMLGLLVGVVWYYRALHRDRLLEPRIVIISVAALLGGAVGAHLITSWEVADEVAQAGLPLTYVLTHGPKSILGGLAGGYLAIVISKRVLGYDLSTGDYYAAAIPLALAIGRIGCFLAELPLGTPTSLPWGMTVSPEAAAAFPRCPGCGGLMHPSMLYEIGFHAAAFALDLAPVATPAHSRRHAEALPAGLRALPLRRRVRAGQRGAVLWADRPAAGAHPADRAARHPLRPAPAQRRLSTSRAAGGADRNRGGS